MKHFLLDTNVLVALFWPAHAQHPKAARWFANKRRAGWATCPFTQAGFVRVISNPAFSRDALRPQDAVKLLKANTSAKDHRFWPVDLGLEQAVSIFGYRLRGHQQVTDAYLLALAFARDGVLASFDGAIASLCEGLPDYRSAFHIIS